MRGADHPEPWSLVLFTKFDQLTKSRDAIAGWSDEVVPGLWMRVGIAMNGQAYLSG
jgi:hypothetical protein